MVTNMTTPDLKELAKKAAEFLGLEQLQNSKEWKFKWHRINWLLSTKDFFEGEFPPILMHLAKREMEKRGFGGFHYTLPHKDGYFIHHFAFIKDYSHSKDSETRVLDKNEFISFWMAVMGAIENEN